MCCRFGCKSSVKASAKRGAGLGRVHCEDGGFSHVTAVLLVRDGAQQGLALGQDTSRGGAKSYLEGGLFFSFRTYLCECNRGVRRSSCLEKIFLQTMNKF